MNLMTEQGAVGGALMMMQLPARRACAILVMVRTIGKLCIDGHCECKRRECKRIVNAVEGEFSLERGDPCDLEEIGCIND